MKPYTHLLLFIGIFLIQASYALQRHRKGKRIVVKKKMEKRETIFIPEVLEMRRRASLGKRSHPAKSCRDIFREVPGAKSGVYWFDIIDKNNRSRQVQYYCKKGDYFEEPNGTFPPENLNAGKAMAEPYDWEELHRETWPSPIDPPDEESMNRKIKQALRERQKEKNGTKQTEIETPVNNDNNNTAIDLNMDSIISSNGTSNNGKIKIVRPKTQTPGKRNSINIKILNFKRIGSSSSKKLNLDINGNSGDGKTTATKKTTMQAISLSPEPVIGTKKSLKVDAAIQEISSGQSKESMEGAVIKEISAAVATKVDKAVAKNGAPESQEQSSVIMEVNKKSKIERVKNLSSAINQTEEETLRTTVNSNPITSSLGGGKFDERKSRIQTDDSVNTSNETSFYGDNTAGYLNNVVSEVAHVNDMETDKKGQTRTAFSGNTVSSLAAVKGETKAFSDSERDGKLLTASTTNAPQNANLSVSNNVPVEYGDQLSQHNWPGQINNLLNQLQINSSGDKRPIMDGEPLTFSQNNFPTEKEGDSPDDIVNSTWPLQLGGILQHVMRDFEKQRELANKYERPEDMFAVLLGGRNNVSSNSTHRLTGSDSNEELAESIVPGDDDTFILNGENDSKASDDSHSLTFAEENSILHGKEEEALSSSDINDALNSMPYASYQSRIKRQLENM